MQEITVTVKSDGSTEVSVKGVRGKGCEALTQALEGALGESKSKKRTGDYHAQQAHHQRQA